MPKLSGGLRPSRRITCAQQSCIGEGVAGIPPRNDIWRSAYDHYEIVDEVWLQSLGPPYHLRHERTQLGRDVYWRELMHATPRKGD